jgi:hypothetical protein
LFLSLLTLLSVLLSVLFALSCSANH